MKLSLNKNSLSNIKEFFSKFFGFIKHNFDSNKNHYKYKIIGEKPNQKDPYNTILLYRIIGKRDNTFEIPIKDLLLDKELIENFHPAETIKIGAIAMGDVLFKEDSETAKKRFHEIKNKMLE